MIVSVGINLDLFAAVTRGTVGARTTGTPKGDESGFERPRLTSWHSQRCPFPSPCPESSETSAWHTPAASAVTFAHAGRCLRRLHRAASRLRSARHRPPLTRPGRALRCPIAAENSGQPRAAGHTARSALGAATGRCAGSAGAAPARLLRGGDGRDRGAAAACSGGCWPALSPRGPWVCFLVMIHIGGHTR